MLQDKNEIIEDDIIEDEIIEDADMVLLAILYDGLETDNIIVDVNNKDRTISATLKQIQYNSRQEFPETGSERLIYVAKNEENAPYIWDSEMSDYVKVGKDYSPDLSKLQRQITENKSNIDTLTQTKVEVVNVNGENAVDGTKANIDITIEQDTGNSLIYYLKINGKTAGTINIPKDQFIRSVTFDSTTKMLKIIWVTTTGEQTTDIDMSSLIDTYTAGHGLELNNGEFKIKVDPETENIVSVSEEGLKVDISSELPTITVFDSVRGGA